MLPFPATDNFQQQLNDLQRSYNQLGKAFPSPLPQPRQLQHVSGVEGAKKHARDEMNSGDTDVVFDDDEDMFYVVSKSQDGLVQPLILGRFTLEKEPPKPEYATKQDFEELKKEILSLLKKEDNE